LGVLAAIGAGVAGSGATDGAAGVKLAAAIVVRGSESFAGLSEVLGVPNATAASAVLEAGDSAEDAGSREDWTGSAGLAAILGSAAATGGVVVAAGVAGCAGADAAIAGPASPPLRKKTTASVTDSSTTARLLTPIRV
jgi:hypothetical protein